MKHFILLLFFCSWHAARMVIVLAEIFASWLKIDQKRNFLAIGLPVVNRKLHTNMPRQAVEMDRRIGLSANRRINSGSH